MTKPVIVFDLGNVLIDWNMDYLYTKLIADKAEREKFYTLIDSVNAENDRGTPWNDVMAGLIASHPEKKDLIVALRDRWIETLGFPIDGTVEILKGLKTAGYRLYAGSNWGRDTFELGRERMPFLSLFDGLQISYAIRVIKPEIRFYQLLGETFRFDLKDSIFIDDRLNNVEGARQAGMDAIHFHNPSQLREELTRRGVTF